MSVYVYVIKKLREVLKKCQNYVKGYTRLGISLGKWTNGSQSEYFVTKRK